MIDTPNYFDACMATYDASRKAVYADCATWLALVKQREQRKLQGTSISLMEVTRRG